MGLSKFKTQRKKLEKMISTAFLVLALIAVATAELDCNGVDGGTAVYDACDVCNGSGDSCYDCAGTLNGPSVYDACDICEGDGSSCSDCAGVPNGPNVYDVCNVCGGDGTSCIDCAGVPAGLATYDECGVCNGDGTACLECDSNCFNLARCYFPFLFERSGDQKFTFNEKRSGSCKNC